MNPAFVKAILKICTTKKRFLFLFRDQPSNLYIKFKSLTVAVISQRGPWLTRYATELWGKFLVINLMLSMKYYSLNTAQPALELNPVLAAAKILLFVLVLFAALRFKKIISVLKGNLCAK